MAVTSSKREFDFVGKRKLFMSISGLACGLIILGIALFGFNWGVDFAGGSEIEVRFAGAVDVAQVRQVMEKAGFEDVTVQEVGSAEDHGFLIRIGRISMLTQADADRARAAVESRFQGAVASFDYNADYGDKFEIRFKEGTESATAEAVKAAVESAGMKVQDLRAVVGGFSVVTSGISDMVSGALDAARDAKGMAQADLQRVEYVGPQVGKQLRNQGILAVFYAALAILLYIAFRFEMRFAPGAIVSLVHDVIFVLGYFLITRREFNLTSVAVLLTIVGYSVNDTIVVYDRIRENMQKMKGKNLADLINMSINQTLSRTVLTGVTTMVSVIGLILFGIGPIWDFAAVMILGVIIGTYSSIFIASPTTLFLEEMRGGGKGAGTTASEQLPAA